MKIVDGRVVAIAISLIFIVAITLPLFADVSRVESRIWIENIDMKVGEVNESNANIIFIISLHSSKTLKNSTIVAKVYDRKTNLLLKEIKKAALSNNLNITISFEKDREYNILFKLLKDGKLMDSRGLSLRGLETLIPKNKELKVKLKDVDFEIADILGNKTKVRIRFYIEAMRDYSDTVFHIKAIQYESNILASEKWLKLNISKGKTIFIESNLTIPKSYNYLIKLEVWRNGSMLKSWYKSLNLAPTKKIPVNLTEKQMKFEVSEFVRSEAQKVYADYYQAKKAPGFEIFLAILSLGGAILWKRRK